MRIMDIMGTANRAAKNSVHFSSTPEANLARFRPTHTNRGQCRSELLTLAYSANCKKKLEARVGIEPTHKGFADLSLTTWVPRLTIKTAQLQIPRQARISP